MSVAKELVESAEEVARVREIILSDPRPFSDPSHPIWHSARPNLEPLPPQSMTVDGLTIRDLGNGIIEMNGVTMAVEFVKTALLAQCPDRLCAFRRDGADIHIKSIGNAESAIKFFEKGWEL